MLAAVGNRATRVQVPKGAEPKLQCLQFQHTVRIARFPVSTGVFARCPPRFREMPPAISRDVHLAKSREISGNLGKPRQISLTGGFHARQSQKGSDRNTRNKESGQTGTQVIFGFNSF